ncbi:glycosyltransferase [Paraflavitalea sp. CAU 1676]|uniref:glycosyltransferase n=1 Tax=Paraflavitalea sp. CAU 1676 TaxID=3032598 RepID=UPI0023D98552|nr:glycosyltransferase [Paraflavitalea sp. CAU 1676]MDF2186887.1 glycosyltransferase [Paraflavitalea sp. CAU 1676]
MIRIKQEKRWLNTVLATHPLDLVISDNRFGLYADGLPAVFITHQLQIKTGLGAWADGIARRWNYRRIRCFSSCWVPDQPESPSLAGELSHPVEPPPFPVRYIGGLTRFKPCLPTLDSNLLIILSGPEPQRSLLEQTLLSQLENYKGRVVLVRGLPLAAALPAVPLHCTVYNHAPAALLQKLICEAGLIISRCGYTTVMDLLALQKRTILVPTPGQAEQEYLASHLLQQRWALTILQENFVLPEALRQAADFAYQFSPWPPHGFKNAVKSTLEEILQHKKRDAP